MGHRQAIDPLASCLIPPTAELGVLDEFSRPDEGFDKIKIRG